MVRFGFLAIILIWTSGSNAQEVPKEAWVSQMESGMSAFFCQEGQYFHECFNGTAAQCNETMTELVGGCLERYEEQFPAAFKMPDDGAKWGQVIGSCAGSQYDVVRRSDRINSAKCNNPNEWM